MSPSAEVARGVREKFRRGRVGTQPRTEEDEEASPTASFRFRGEAYSEIEFRDDRLEVSPAREARVGTCVNRCRVETQRNFA